MVVLHAEVAKIGPRSFRINNRFSKSNRPKDLRDKKETELIGLCAKRDEKVDGKVPFVDENEEFLTKAVWELKAVHSYQG